MLLMRKDLTRITEIDKDTKKNKKGGGVERFYVMAESPMCIRYGFCTIWICLASENVMQVGRIIFI